MEFITIQDNGLSTDVDTVIMPYLLQSYTLPIDIENAELTGTNTGNLTGNANNNTLKGNEANNTINALSGRDSVSGGIGDDLINGGADNDILTGGLGRDIFRFDTLPNSISNQDKIIDFSITDDIIQLENSVFTKLSTTGIINNDYLKLGTVVVDSNDYIIYNKTTGGLYYDADGSGVLGAVQIATLGVNLNVTNANFVVT